MPADEELDLCEFGVVHEKCYFCGQPRTILFNEHYTFCPNCAVIYTDMIIQESNCDHIKSGVPVVISDPWFSTPNRQLRKTHIYLLDGMWTMQFCSKCNAECVADGW
jgi:hypothetical protein